MVLTQVLQDGTKKIVLGTDDWRSNRRYLTPSKGKRLVGVEGQMDSVSSEQGAWRTPSSFYLLFSSFQSILP